MMICRISFIIFLTLGTFSITQTTGSAGTSTVPNVVTADIEAGIQHYIEEKMRLGGGYFTLPFEEKELKLKLVRVHTEYLANLGPVTGPGSTTRSRPRLNSIRFAGCRPK